MTPLLGVAAVARAQSSELAPAPTPSAPSEEAAPTNAAAMNAAAKLRYEKGLELYGHRNFHAAIAEFEEGFAVEPRREFLFAEAQAYRLAGDCARAVPLFQRFLATQPSAIQIDATRLALDRCAQQTPPRPEGAAAPGKVFPQPTRNLPLLLPRPLWWKDAWGATALGAAVVAGGVGAGFLVASNRSWDAAHASHAAPEFDRLIAEYERRHAAGVTCLVAGATLGAAGLVRFAYVRHRDHVADERAPSLIAVEPLTHGAALWWKGSF